MKKIIILVLILIISVLILAVAYLLMQMMTYNQLYLAEKNHTNILEERLRNKSIEEKIKFGFKYYLNTDYATDGRNIYINAYDGGSTKLENYQIAKEVDYRTFQLLDFDWGRFFKDKNNVYYNRLRYLELEDNLMVLENIDPGSVGYVSAHCLKDKNGVYCQLLEMTTDKNINMQIIEGADPETFVALGEHEKYFKDKDNIYCNQFEKGINIKKLGNVDINSFEIIADSLDNDAKDKNSVFRLCDRVVN